MNLRLARSVEIAMVAKAAAVMRSTSIGDLFAGAAPSGSDERLADGAVILRGFAQPETSALSAAVGKKWEKKKK